VVYSPKEEHTEKKKKNNHHNRVFLNANKRDSYGFGSDWLLCLCVRVSMRA